MSVLVIAEIQTCRAAQLVELAVEQFLCVVELLVEHFDAIITAVSDPDAMCGVDDDRARFVELVGVGAGRRAVAASHLPALSVDETDAM